MNDVTVTATGGEPAPSEVNASLHEVAATVQPDNTPLSPSEAWAAYTERSKREREQGSTAGAENTAAAATESAAEAGADPQPEAPGETQANEPAGELPPIEPPRSWTKDEKERFASLPRETQEYLANREQERDRDFRTRQNELATQRQAFDAEREQTTKVRQEYEAKLPAMKQALLDLQSSQFPDIRSMDDLERIANEAVTTSITDPPRSQQLLAYLKAFDIHQQKLQAISYDLDQAQQRQATEEATNWKNFKAEQTAKVTEFHPELADSKKADELGKLAAELFLEKKFTPQDIQGFMNGKTISPYHAGFQSIVIDAVKYREAQKAIPKAIPKTVPQVLKPGAAQPKGAAGEATLRELNSRFNQSGSLKDAFAVYSAKKANAAAQR